MLLVRNLVIWFLPQCRQAPGLQFIHMNCLSKCCICHIGYTAQIWIGQKVNTTWDGRVVKETCWEVMFCFRTTKHSIFFAMSLTYSFLSDFPWKEDNTPWVEWGLCWPQEKEQRPSDADDAVNGVSELLAGCLALCVFVHWSPIHLAVEVLLSSGF